MADDVQKIAQRIELTGEKEYNAALKEARQNLRVLQSQLKAETAELGKNATAQEKNEVKTRNLQKQIKEQEKVVRAYEKALAASTEKYGESAEATAKWEVKLNDARTALANMKNGLNDVSEGMKQVQGSAQLGVIATHSLAESLGKVAEAGSAISGAIEGAFSGTMDFVKDVISQVWESVVDLAARSNSMVDLAGYWNTDVTTIQKYKGAVESASGSLEDLASLVTRINSKDPTELVKLTGVSKENFKDDWSYAMAVLEKVSTLENHDQRNAIAYALFGRNPDKALDLMNDWQTVMANLDKFDPTKGGYGLTEEQTQSMSELYDKVNGLRASWQALQDMATVHLFGDLAMNVTGNLQNIVDAFKDYFLAESDDEKAEALEKVKQNIIEMFDNIRTAIQEGIELLSGLAEDLKDSDDELARALGNALGALVDALEWLADENNWATIKSGIEWLIGIWAAGKVGSAIGNLASFGANLKTIFGWTGGKGTPAPAPTTPTVAPTGGNGATWISKLTSGTGVYAALKNLELLKDKLESDKAELEQQTAENGWSESDRNYWMLTGKKPDANDADYQNWLNTVVNPDPLAGKGTKYVNGFGPSSPVERARLDATPEQQAAANALWDLIREGNFGSEYDNAWAALENAFAGDTGTFARLDALLNKLIEEHSAAEEETGYNPELWGDIPSTWWQNPAGQNGLTSSDISGFRSLPGQMRAAVASGVSGIKVYMSGQEVGNLVAPYVSEALAAQMD